MNLSIVTTCKSRLAHLKQALPAMVKQPGAEVVVVDYDCPDGTAAWVKGHHPSVKVVKVENRPGFNTCEARNLGAAASAGDWLCFMDADVLPAPDFSAHFAARAGKGSFYIAAPRVASLHGTCVVPREAFEKVGGYDEIIEPWGFDDTDLYARLGGSGLKLDHYPSALLTEIPHDDAARSRYIEGGDHRATLERNALYYQAKRFLAQAIGSQPDLETRRHLYAEIKRVLLGSPDRCEITFDLPPVPQIQVAPGRRVETRIVVALQREPVIPAPPNR